MNLRDTARKLNDHGKFEYLRNKANKLVQRDKILSVLKGLNGNPAQWGTYIVLEDQIDIDMCISFH